MVDSEIFSDANRPIPGQEMARGSGQASTGQKSVSWQKCCQETERLTDMLSRMLSANRLTDMLSEND